MSGVFEKNKGSKWELGSPVSNKRTDTREILEGKS